MRIVARPARIAVLVTALSAGFAAPAAGQLPDPWVVPRGALRVSFEPSYLNFDEWFDATGSRLPLGAYLSADSLGVGMLPTLAAAESAVRSITGDASFRFHAGAFRARLDADIRRFPFSVALGLSSRLTFTATVPLVTTRVQAAAILDTAAAEAGVNLASSLGRTEARDSIVALFAELDAAAAALESGIAAGSFGCPSGPTCDQARALLDRVRALRADLSALAGIPGLITGDGSAPAPPFAPLATSTAGRAITQAVADVSAELATLGLAALANGYALPATPASAAGVDAILAGDDFGYGLGPLSPVETVTLSGLGDIEVGLRYALVQGPGLRAVVGLLARLPTGKRDDPDNLLDLATGDRQTDVMVSVDAALEPGARLGLWLGASYTLQLADRLSRRVTPTDQPIALAASEAIVDRNLGDILRVSVHPTLRLTPEFRAFVSAFYLRKGADRYSAPVLDTLTAMETWGFGAGLWYRADRGRRGPALPLEAGIVYDAAFFGSGGTTPKTGRLGLSLRLYYRLWGGSAAAPAATAN